METRAVPQLNFGCEPSVTPFAPAPIGKLDSRRERRGRRDSGSRGGAERWRLPRSGLSSAAVALSSKLEEMKGPVGPDSPRLRASASPRESLSFRSEEHTSELQSLMRI